MTGLSALLAKALAIATLVASPCPVAPPPGADEIAACTMPAAIVYIDPRFEAPGDLNHELGHVIDFNFLTDQDRGGFEFLIHRHGAWWEGESASGGHAPGEQFAEAVRLCTRSEKWPAWAGYGYTPSVRTHRRICRWLDRLGDRLTAA